MKHALDGRYRLLFAVVTATLLIATGCPEDDPPPDPVVSGNNSTNQNANNMTTGDAGGGDTGMETDMGPTDPVDMGPVDMGPPGFMNGTWEVQRASDDELVATLALRHKEGSTEVQGSYTMADGTGPDTGNTLSNGSWMDDTFSAAWSFRIDGVDQEFQLTNAVSQDDTTLLGRFNDPRVAQPFDVFVRKIE